MEGGGGGGGWIGTYLIVFKVSEQSSEESPAMLLVRSEQRVEVGQQSSWGRPRVKEATCLTLRETYI